MLPGSIGATSAPQIAIVTPSYEGDFDLCVLLNRSVLAFTAGDIKHYIIVPARNLRTFRVLEGERTVLLTQEDVAPKLLVQLPISRKWWYSNASLLPVRGWLTQQIVKISLAMTLRERVLVMLDSDAMFLREAKTAWFLRDGRTRLYRCSGGIKETQASHIRWHGNAARLLGLAPAPPPMDDYIGSLISWDRRLVLEMCNHVERVTGVPWHVALIRVSAFQQVSEYLLYGLFVESVLGSDAGVWVDDRPGGGCHTYWDKGKPLSVGAAERFAEEMGPDQIAVMLSSYSGTNSEVRNRILERAIASRTRALSSVDR